MNKFLSWICYIIGGIILFAAFIISVILCLIIILPFIAVALVATLGGWFIVHGNGQTIKEYFMDLDKHKED